MIEDVEGASVEGEERSMSSIQNTATAATKMLEGIEVNLMILVDQQQKLIGGTLPYNAERTLLATQRQAMGEI